MSKLSGKAGEIVLNCSEELGLSPSPRPPYLNIPEPELGPGYSLTVVDFAGQCVLGVG